jgi:predicted nuclease of restriction endonuclease-like RecB superfamily
MGKNDKTEATIENRVYLFESLASAFLEKASADLTGKNPARQARVIRALADLAYVSCAVADSGHLSPKAVRRKVLNAVEVVEMTETSAASRQQEGDEPNDED